MSKFFAPLDIKNRALQHLGARQMASATEVSKNALEVNSVYDDVRVAELRRNVWRFAIRLAVLRPIDVTSYLYVPPAWSSTATYARGQIVSYSNILYQATALLAANIEPDTNPASWTQYFGPMTVTPWFSGAVNNGPQPWSSAISYASNAQVIGSDGNLYYSNTNGNVNNNPVNDGGIHWTYLGLAASGQGYYQSELVYTPTGPNPGVYLSLSAGNNDTPTVVPAWVNTVTYNTGDTVTYSNVVYQSTIDMNVGQTPTGTGDWVVIPGGQVGSSSGQNWLLLGGSIKSLRFLYPLGTGPATQSATRNVFMLPNGFLRRAPQDPKAGSFSWLGASTALTYDDWDLQDDFIISRISDPIVLRFVADISDVTMMDPMFCEGLGGRIGMEVGETLTQSEAKVNMAASAYGRFMAEARDVNGIETDSTEPPEDDYITCRI